LVSNHHGYRLVCADAESERRMAMSAGFTDAELGRLKDYHLGDQAVQDLFGGNGFIDKSQLTALPCNLPQYRLYEVDVPMEAGVDKRLVVNLGDTTDSGKVILHNIGCGQLLSNMGVDVLHPTTPPFTLA